MSKILKYASLAIYFLVAIALIRVVELYKLQLDAGFDFWASLQLAITNDLLMGCVTVLFVSPFFFFLSKGKLVSRFLLVIVLLIHIILTHYFIESFELLDGIILNFSLTEIGIIIASTSENLELSDFVMFAIEALFIALLLFLPLRKSKTSLVLFIIVLVWSAVNFDDNYKVLDNQIANRIYPNKTIYLFKGINKKLSTKNRQIPYSDEEITAAGQNYQGLYNKQFSSLEYPFQNTSEYPNVLGPFFPKKNKKPNVVFIALESMSRVFSGPNADLASFTPFMDSLATKSLYWSNCLSNAKKTSGIFSNLYSSAPYGNERGLVNIEYLRPKHNSIINLLKNNDYQTNYYYSGNLDFDNMKNYLYDFKLDKIVEENDFVTPKTIDYKLLKNNEFGYADEVLYNEYLTTTSSDQKPRLDMLLTLSLHCNFKNLTDYDSLYFSKVASIDSIKFKQFIKQYIGAKGDWELNYNYEYILKTVLYVDEALKQFFEAYKKRSDYDNTIFVIAGDHYIHRFPLKNIIQNRHVPLWIYSPMLTKAKQSNALVLHNDIVPSLTSLLSNNFGLNFSKKNHWLGVGLDTSTTFKANRVTALQDDRITHHTYINNEFVYDSDLKKLYRMDSLLNLIEVKNSDKKQELKQNLKDFNILNEYVVKKDRVIE